MSEPRGVMPPPPALWTEPVESRGGRTRRAWRWAVGVLAVAMFVVGGVIGWLWWSGEQIAGELSAGYKAPIVADARGVLGTEAADSDIDIPAAMSSAGITNFLLIGSDARAATSGGNSDTLILARLDDRANTLSLLSVPRDLKVPIPGHQDFKVNAAYAYGGPALAIRTFRDYFGVRIDHFAVVDFSGFTELVDRSGGVYLPVDQRYFNRNDGSSANNYADIDVEAGYQRLNGTDALAFARYRHNDSDFFRQARQALFLSELKRIIQDRVNPSSPRSSMRTLRQLAKLTTSDVDSLDDLLELVGAIRRVPSERIYRFTIPARGWVEADGRYYLHADRSDVHEVVRAWANPSAADADQAPQPDVAGVGDSAVVRGPTSPPSDRSAPDTSAASIIASYASSGLNLCAPQRRPEGSVYLDANHRSYELNGASAVAMSGRIGPGRHFLWMWSNATDIPMLAAPTATKRHDGRTFSVYRRGGKTHAVSFTRGKTSVWLTNTLRGELNEATMLAMAASCR